MKMIAEFIIGIALSALILKSMWEILSGVCRLIFGIGCLAVAMILGMMAASIRKWTALHGSMTISRDFGRFAAFKPTPHSRLLNIASHLRRIWDKAIKHPVSSMMSLCMIAGVAAISGAFCQDSSSGSTERHQTQLPLNRVITSSDGRAMAGTITAVDGGVIRFRRQSDGRTVDIPLANLSEADKQFVQTWDPPSKELRPSSVSISGSPTLARGSYPSRYQPRYSGGSSGGPRGYRVYRQKCTGRTIVVPHIRNNPNCAKPTVRTVVPSTCTKRIVTRTTVRTPCR